jgi:hypothetical protein
LAASGILSLTNLIVGGDLNIFLEADESWGGVHLPEPNGAHFKEIFALQTTLLTSDRPFYPLLGETVGLDRMLLPGD